MCFTISTNHRCLFSKWCLYYIYCSLSRKLTSSGCWKLQADEEKEDGEDEFPPHFDFWVQFLAGLIFALKSRDSFSMFMWRGHFNFRDLEVCASFWRAVVLELFMTVDPHFELVALPSSHALRLDRSDSLQLNFNPSEWQTSKNVQGNKKVTFSPLISIYALALKIEKPKWNYWDVFCGARNSLDLCPLILADMEQ